MENLEQQLTKKEKRELKRREKLQRHTDANRNRLLKRAGIWIIALVAVGGIIFGMIKLAGSPQSEQTTKGKAPAVSTADKMKGNKDAKVTLIEYSDFQCPACGSYYPMLKKLNEEFSKQILFIYRHFPLRQIHKNAEPAAEAAEAAGKQGKFWEMHDTIFENQSEWSSLRNTEGAFEKYAGSIDLDMQKFKTDIESEEVKNKVSRDYDGGFRAGVNATPAFFLNGEPIKNPGSYDEFRDIINKSIADSNNS